jgi:diacylglycerol kinase family enzyme
VNIVSVGLGGLVDRYVAESRRTFGGSAAYAIASARALARAREGHVRCDLARGEARETRHERAYLIAICNGRYFGGGMRIAPMAAPDDGQLDVIALAAPSKLAFTMLARRIYEGSHVREPGTTQFACDAIELTLENEEARDVFLLDVDGEPLGRLPARITLVRHALRVCVRGATA